MSTLNRRLISGALVLVAFALLYVAGRDADTGVQVTQTVSAVERVIPERGAIEVQQARIGLDLAAGYTGVLIVDGIEIPEDQLERIEPLNEVYFQPRDGREIERFSTGQVCVTGVYWLETQSRAQSQTVNWCFRVGA